MKPLLAGDPVGLNFYQTCTGAFKAPDEYLGNTLDEFKSEFAIPLRCDQQASLVEHQRGRWLNGGARFKMPEFHPLKQRVRRNFFTP